MTPKQAMFIKEYLVDLNATQAAIRAGYSWVNPLGYYVYLLVDPRGGKIFYIGKGKGKRHSMHVKKAAKGLPDNGVKTLAICEILQSGQKVEELIFASGLTEGEAFRQERILIGRLRHSGISNISGGIVTSREHTIASAKSLLSRIKPFKEWSESLDGARKALAISIFGSLQSAYDDIRLSISEVLLRC